jgi:hypothetical protein
MEWVVQFVEVCCEWNALSVNPENTGPSPLPEGGKSQLSLNQDHLGRPCELQIDQITTRGPRYTADLQGARGG